MKANLRNIILTASTLVLPLEPAYCAKSIKKIDRKIPESAQLITINKQSSKANNDFFNRPLEILKNLEKKKSLNLIKMPKPQKELDVSETKFVGHPEFLNMFLKGVLKGKGEQFIKAQEKYGINASFLVGIANLESGNGLSDYAINRNNIAGMRNMKGYMFFDSVDECIDRMAENLKRNYIDMGLTTIQKINGKYAKNPEWAKLVVGRMNPMYNASKHKIYCFDKM